MSEYIERKAVINKVSEIPAHFDSGDIRYGIEIAIQAIKDTPSADVVEVVRLRIVNITNISPNTINIFATNMVAM